MEAKAEVEAGAAGVFTPAGIEPGNVAGDLPPLPPPKEAPSPTDVGAVCLDLGTGDTEISKEVKPDMLGTPSSQAEGISPSTLTEVSTMSKEELARHTEYARQISVFSLIVSLLAAVLGLGIGFAEETLSLVGFGLESSLDGLSSALVLWRFKKPKQRQHQDDEAAIRFKAIRDARRERNSSIGIGATFVASAALLMASAAYKLTSWDPNEETHIREEQDGANYSVWLSVPSFGVFGVLALAKFRLSRMLGSQVLEKDALCSLLGATLALICSLAGIVEEHTASPDNMVAVDSAASSIIAVILLVEGSRTLWHNLSPAWQGDHRPFQ